MKYIIVWIIILSAISPAQAYGSGNTIYVKRQRPSKPSLLDRKFVIRTVASDIRSESTETNLTAMHQQLAAKPAATKIAKAPAQKPQTPSSNNWNDFATEAEWTDSRDVSAKLIQ